jgi:hypothetical protein|tara:strand:+ start:867 stop:1325 length:459 start_codon:yes stop_codon:yes gene_type:complete
MDTLGHLGKKLKTFCTRALVLLVFTSLNFSFANEITSVVRSNPLVLLWEENISPTVDIIYYNEKADTAQCMIYSDNAPIGSQEVFVINMLAKMEINIPLNIYIQMLPFTISCRATSYLSAYKNQTIPQEFVSCVNQTTDDGQFFECRKIKNN